MFSPPKLTAIVLTSLAVLLLFSGTSDAQQAEFNRRVAAMQEARSRAQQPATVRVASADIGVDYSAPPSPGGVARVAQAQTRQPARQSSNSRRVVLGQSSRIPARQAQARQVQRVAQAPQANRVASKYSPQHTRTAQLMDSTFVDGGSPIISEYSDGGFVDGGYVDDGYIDGGCQSCGDGGCSSCGDTSGYFDDSCCDRGGCPPGPCWLTGFGMAFYNGEYFGGATSFRSTLFSTPGGTTNQLSDDCSHGFYGGFNLGIPLCKLTCGVFSGQVGVRSVQTNFNGNQFSNENRDQLFVTAGFYRRVDYGLQAGVVADILHEEWFTETDLVQVRADLGWVYPNGSTLGFRYATNVQDDVNSGTFAGNAFSNLIQSTDDTYRFYYRKDSPAGGFGEGSVGWSGGQTILGLDFDLPITERVAMQSGFSYYLGDEGVPANSGLQGGNADDAYNLYVGLSFRPRGRSFYQSYDRPLFSVADNGTMLITRQ